MAVDPKHTVEGNLACLEDDAKRLLTWVSTERRLTEPVQFDYRGVLEGMQWDIQRLRILLASPERAAAVEHRDSDMLVMP